MIMAGQKLKVIKMLFLPSNDNSVRVGLAFVVT